MRHVYIVPMLPVKMRYSAWWNTFFLHKLRDVFKGQRAVTMAMACGRPYENFDNSTQFFNAQLDWELDWLHWLHNLDLQPTDVVLVLDCATPGLIGSYLHTRKPCPFLGICHGTSFNRHDIFPDTRNLFDLSILSAYDRVLVASEYHRAKLLNIQLGIHDLHRDQVINMGALPDMPEELIYDVAKPPFCQRDHVCIVDRNTPQKRDMKALHILANKLLNEPVHDAKGQAYSFGVADIHGTTHSWNEYLTRLAQFKFMVVTAQEETYGYQVHDAMSVGTIPIVPNDCAYPESVPQNFTYTRFTLDNSEQNALRIYARIRQLMLGEAMFGGPIVPNNRQQIDDFFPRLGRLIEEVSQ